MPYMMLSTGGKYEHVPLHGYSRRETEKSKLKRLQREADKTADEDERKFKENIIRKLERKGEGFDLPLRDVETSTGADYNPYRDQRRQAERQRYARLSFDDKESYLESRIRTGTEERERNELRGKIEALGGEVPFELRDPNRLSKESIRRAGLRGEVPPAIAFKKGLERLHDIQKGEATELDKERREKAASHRKALDIIKFTESRVVDPEVDNVMHRGDPDKEYVLDTFTEAKREIEKEGRLGRTLSAEEEKALRAISFPPLSKDGGKDGGAVDEYLEQQKQKDMEMKEAGFVRKPDGTWAKSVVAKETLEDKLTRIMEEQRVKIQTSQIYKKATVAERKYLAEKGARTAKIFAWIGGVPIGIKGQSEKKKPPKTQEEAYSFALQAKVDVNDPAIKEGILALPSGDKEGWGWFGKEYPLIPETYSAKPDEVQDREYSEEEEIDIRDNMKAHGKSREEVISAMKQRGHLK